MSPQRSRSKACAWLGLTLLTAWLGCKVDERTPDVASPASAVGSLGTGAAGSSGVSGPEEGTDPNLPLLGGQAGLEQGAACRESADCSTGNCVDGVCCDSACTDLCAACNVPGSVGICTAASTDPLCPTVSCQGQSSECRPLDNGQTGVNCDGIGVCRTNAGCTPVPAPQGTPCQQGTGACDGQGACLVANESALGATCAGDNDCAEGHCVAGQGGAKICCDAACDGVCQACSAAGHCEATPGTDARCPPVTCPADNVCRDYVASITDNLCGSFGQCRTALDCGTPSYFTSLKPSAQCVCDPASGACTLAVGTSCAQGSNCASGQCVATAQGNSVCCAGPCAAGLFCSSAGTGCVQCEGTQIDCDGNNQRTCNAGALVTTACPNGCTPGTGCNPVPPVGFLCSGQCAAGAVCQQDTGGQQRCCVRDCAAEGKVCSPSGSCDCPQGQLAASNSCLLQAGDPCQNTPQCQSGLTCVDGVCCQSACNGYCEQCQAGTGLCQPIPAGQQEVDTASGNSCSNGFECTGVLNGCKARTGQGCSSTDGSDCVSGACQATAGGGARVCCSQSCGNGLFCRSNGQGCVQCESAAQCANGCNTTTGMCNPLKGLSASCTVAAQCASNFCVSATDGGSRCCPNCRGQQCTPQGTCAAPLSNPGGPCSTSNDCLQGSCGPNRICCKNGCSSGCRTDGSCDCPIDRVFSPQTQTCDCPSGLVFSAQAQSCVVPAVLQAASGSIDFGTQNPTISGAPINWSFPNVGGIATNPFTLTGTGDVRNFPTSGSCGAIQPNQECVIAITFVPDQVSGSTSYAATYTLTEQGGSLTATMTVTGVGVL